MNKSDNIRIEKSKKIEKNIAKKKEILLITLAIVFITGLLIFLYYNKSNKSNIKFDADEAMRFNDDKISVNEFLLYAADVYQGYNLQDEANWDSTITDPLTNETVTYEEKVKATICEQIRMTKVLCLKAKATGISLSNDEKELLINNARTYHANLVEAGVVDKNLTTDLITLFYEENAIAQKVYLSITDNYDGSAEEESGEYEGHGDLTAKELYFIDSYRSLASKYDSNYNYNESINWELLNKISFSELSKSNIDTK